MCDVSTDKTVIGSTLFGSARNLIIKARFNNNFKKTAINNDELTYDELILMLQRLFNGKFDAKDDVKLKYRDEDGDLVDIDNDFDLKSAIQSNRYLKLFISLGDEDDFSLLDRVSLSKKEFRKLLTESMEIVIERILKSLKTNEPVKPENSTDSSFTIKALNNDGHVVHTLNNLTLSDSKEFDPLVNETDDIKSEKSTAVQEEESIKSLNSISFQNTSKQVMATNERHQPATLQPSAQQFQSTQNLQPKILNQSQQQYQQPLSNQPPMMSAPNQQQQKNQPMPYRYGIPPSSNANPPPSRPTTFNPNDMQGSSHPQSSYPTPSSTPANTFGMNQMMNQPPLMNQQQLTSPPGPQQLPSYPPISGLSMSGPNLSGPPTSMNANLQQLTSPPHSNSLQSGPQSAFGPPPTQNQPQLDRTVGPPPTGPVPQHLQQQQQQQQQPPPPPPQQQQQANQSSNQQVQQQNNPPPSMQFPPSSSSNQQLPPQNGAVPQNTNAPQSNNFQGPPQFTNFMPPTGPYPGQQAPKNNPFSRNVPQARYAYPQQFNQSLN